MIRTFATSLGLVALAVAAMVGLLAVAGVFGEQISYAPSAAGPSAVGFEAPDSQAPRQPALSVGQPVTIGDVTWTVVDAHRRSELHKYTFPRGSVSGHFVTITFTVENVSERPVTLTEETITLFDAAGHRFWPAADRNNAFVEPELNILFNEFSLIQPGQTAEGKVNFEVLAGSSGFVAVLGDTDPTVDNERYVYLGF